MGRVSREMEQERAGRRVQQPLLKQLQRRHVEAKRQADFLWGGGVGLVRTVVRGEAWKRREREGACCLINALGGAFLCAAPVALQRSFW